MKATGWDEQQLADALGVTVRTIHDYLNGRQNGKARVGEISSKMNYSADLLLVDAPEVKKISKKAS